MFAFLQPVVKDVVEATENPIGIQVKSETDTPKSENIASETTSVPLDEPKQSTETTSAPLDTPKQDTEASTPTPVVPMQEPNNDTQDPPTEKVKSIYKMDFGNYN